MDGFIMEDYRRMDYEGPKRYGRFRYGKVQRWMRVMISHGRRDLCLGVQEGGRHIVGGGGYCSDYCFVDSLVAIIMDIISRFRTSFLIFFFSHFPSGLCHSPNLTCRVRNACIASVSTIMYPNLLWVLNPARMHGWKQRRD